MPFRDSNFVRPLYDQQDGGPPSAWKCLCDAGTKLTPRSCGKITRTLTGMRCHQFRIHGFKEQVKLNFPVSS